MVRLIIYLLLLFNYGEAMAQQKFIGKIIAYNDDFFELVGRNAQIEQLSEGYQWSEGPVWVKSGGFLLFSDVKANTIYKWKEGEGASVFLSPSGYTGVHPYSAEPGSNGLILNNKRELVTCEHGDRRISAMPLQGGGKRTIADNYKGTRFNSPNDIVQKSNGDYYFTDPAYGLPGQTTTNKLGVYLVKNNGEVALLAKDMTPNGLAFSPNEETLYIAQSLPGKCFIYAYKVKPDGTLENGKVFFDASALEKQGLPGLPDGLKIDIKGNLFATGPGGVMVINPKGKLLGRIETGQPTANCNWGDNGSVLYITANNILCRIATLTKGNGW